MYMCKMCSCWLVFFILFCGIFNGTVNAAEDKPRLLEEIYSEMGYKTVEDAVREFEQHYNNGLKLPPRLPAIDFTHHFGRFNDLEGEINDSLEIDFINENSAEHHFKINVRPVKYKIPMKAKKIIKLKNGNDAIYTEVTGFNLFVFERDGWQYIFSIDKKLSDSVTPEVFMEIANSIDNPVENKK